jgi:hypothetical protein
MAQTREARLAYLCGVLAAETGDTRLMAEVHQIIAQITADESGEPYPADPLNPGEELFQNYVNQLWRDWPEDWMTADGARLMMNEYDIKRALSHGYVAGRDATRNGQ